MNSTKQAHCATDPLNVDECQKLPAAERERGLSPQKQEIAAPN